MTSRLSSVSKSINGVIHHSSLVSNVLKVALIVVLVFMTSIPRKVLAVFENVFFQIFYLALMAYVALNDAPLALVMAAVYLFAVQQLNKSVPHKNIASQQQMPTQVTLPAVVSMKEEELLQTQQKNLDDTMRVRKDMMSSQREVLQNVMPDAMTLEKDQLKTQQMMLNNSFPNDYKLANVKEDFEDDHPAFKTMTENIATVSNMFTSPQQLVDVQSNELLNINQKEGIKAWSTQFSAQGLDLPHGFDHEEYRGAPVA
jgi:hypothetical protein